MRKGKGKEEGWEQQPLTEELVPNRGDGLALALVLSELQGALGVAVALARLLALVLGVAAPDTLCSAGVSVALAVSDSAMVLELEGDTVRDALGQGVGEAEEHCVVEELTLLLLELLPAPSVNEAAP